jgi:hypothetical protein
MTGSHIRVGFAVAALGFTLSTGVAAAAEIAGCPFSDCVNQNPNGDVLPNSEQRTTPPENAVLPQTETRDVAPSDEVADELPAAVTAPVSSGGVLPFTGADVSGMLTIAAAAVGAGAVMVRRTRSRTAK